MIILRAEATPGLSHRKLSLMNSDEGRDFVPAPDAENKQWMWAHPGGIIYSTPLKAQGMLQERG